MKHVQEIKKLVATMKRSPKFHLLTIMGPAGWAKSYTVKSALKSLRAKHQELGSYATPLALYNQMASEPRTTLVIDDTSGIFHNAQSLAILKAASWPNGADGRRVVAWGSTSNRVLCPSFEFAGKVIVLTNSMPMSPDAMALVNRAFHYTIRLDYETIVELIDEAVADEGFFPDRKLAKAVAEFLKRQGRYHEGERFSLRTLEMGVELARLAPKNWRELLLNTLPKAQDAAVVRELLQSSKNGTEWQVQRFREITGKSRRTFFYIKKRLGLGARGPVRGRDAVQEAKVKKRHARS